MIFLFIQNLSMPLAKDIFTNSSIWVLYKLYLKLLQAAGEPLKFFAQNFSECP